jgi:uncharacterized SAM-binding protein YcdF (DUF218 family)
MPMDESIARWSPRLRSAVEVLWDFHRMGHELAPADGILVFGSNDLRVAEHAAELFHLGLAPWVLFSGGRGRMTMNWPETEAEAMARVARDRGVPESAVLIEPAASHTGENIRFSRELLARRGLRPETAIIVQKPYMERRSIAALAVQWPEVAFRASSPPLDFRDYCTAALPAEMVVSAMLGDFRRLIEYPALGFAAAQQIPAEAMAAYRLLVEGGFDSHAV